MPSDTRDRLVRVARDLIHGSSYAEVSVEDICAAADVRRGSLYHFFASKEALGLAVLEANWAMMRALLDEAFDAEIPPLDRIDRFVAGFAAMMARARNEMPTTPGCPLGNLTAELSTADAATRTRITEILDSWARYFSDAVREAQVRGDLPGAIDPRTAALGILAHLQGMALLAKAYDQPRLVEQSRAAVRALLGA
ncbi:transcriptional regulator, TetR family [Micromonospora nigra]|uniref:Transcriptional regulator, TetR family n=1 Tax=Micromonospora nigra TaxID=145857 RepID=A0A1C6RWQ6_9ACTN|nr:TetR/AcrR family transcriptional regulator [Micromonospora nigra]SCL21638.1 transcriptional regulator, TetR family [Micromonospora nigra]